MFESSEGSGGEESDGEESSEDTVRVDRIPRSEESEILNKPSSVFDGSSKSHSGSGSRSSGSRSSKSASGEEASESESEKEGPPVINVGEIRQVLRKLQKEIKLDLFDPIYRTIVHVKDKKGRPLPPIPVG